MIKNFFKKARGFTPVELVIVMAFAALSAGALIYLATTPHYLASSQPVDIRVKMENPAVPTSRQPIANAADSASSANPKTWIVDASGNGDKTDIQSAVDAANPGDTILVGAGSYTGAYITKKLDIIGIDNVNINNGVDANGYGFLIGFVINGENSHDADGSSISNFTMDCNENIRGGFYGRDVDNITVSSLTINNAQQAITNWDGSGWNITKNKITGLRDYEEWWPAAGITINGSVPGVTTEHNLVAFNEIDVTNTAEEPYFVPYNVYGIELSSSLTNVTNNTIIRNKVNVGQVAMAYSVALALEDLSAAHSNLDNYFGCVGAPGPVLLTKNKFVGLNDFKVEGSDVNLMLFPGNSTTWCGELLSDGYPDLTEYNTFSPTLGQISKLPAKAKGTGAENSFKKTMR